MRGSWTAILGFGHFGAKLPRTSRILRIPKMGIYDDLHPVKARLTDAAPVRCKASLECGRKLLQKTNNIVEKLCRNLI